MKKLALVLMILVLALLAGTAGAAEMINPDRQAAEEAGEFARKLYEQRTGGSGAVKSNDYAAGLRVTCNRNPSLNGTGSWSIALVGHRASEVTRMVCYLSHIDWCEDYSHTHWVDKSRKKGDTNPFMGTYTTPKILTSGKYQLTIYTIYEDDTMGWYQQEFTISGTDVLKNKINSVVAGCKGSTQWETALNLHDWLTHNIYYDKNLEFYGADAMLRGYGVCDSYSKCYLMLCRAAGIPVYRVTNNDHAWNAIKLGEEWFYVDCTWDDPTGGEKTPVSGNEHHDYFCVNDTLLGLDHPQPWSWSYFTLQPCTSLSANYLVHTGEWKKWGINYTYDPASQCYTVHTFSEEIGTAVSEGRAEVIFPDGIWWSGSGAGIGGRRPNAYKRLCLEYALSHTGIPVPGSDKVKVSALWQRTDNAIIVRLLGWDIRETGTLTLPGKLQTVPAEAFMKSGATTLEIPNGCKSIGAGAFRDSRIRTVTVPASVTQIAEDAFDGCGKIIFKTNGTDAVRYASEHGILVVDP